MSMRLGREKEVRQQNLRNLSIGNVAFPNSLPQICIHSFALGLHLFQEYASPNFSREAIQVFSQGLRNVDW